MYVNGTPFVLANRMGRVQHISLTWLVPFVLLASCVQYWLRNLGGILLVLSTAILSGGTLFSYWRASTLHLDLHISWGQTLISVVMLVVCMVAFARMNVDWADFGVDDLLG